MLYLYLLCVSVYCLISMIDIFYIQVLLREKIYVHVCMYVSVHACVCVCVCVRERERERERERAREREWWTVAWQSIEEISHDCQNIGSMCDWQLGANCHLFFLLVLMFHELWNLYLPRKRQFLSCLFYCMDCWLLSWSLQAI